jgi:hypothetical protein
VEEERLRLGDGRPGRRRRLTPGRTAGEGSESGRMAAGEGYGATGNGATLSYFLFSYSEEWASLLLLNGLKGLLLL